MHNFTIKVELSRGQSWPQYQINYNLISNHVTNTEDKIIISHDIATDTPELILEYINKPVEETVVDSDGSIVRDQYIRIHSIYYNNILLDLNLIQNYFSYYPRYREDFIKYCNEHSIKLIIGPLNDTQFWHAGTWTFKFDHDFWSWYEKLRLTRALHSVSHSHAKEYIGYQSNELQTKLMELKNFF